MHSLEHFFTLSHTLLLHDFHLNTGLLSAELQANWHRIKPTKWLIKFNLTHTHTHTHTHIYIYRHTHTHTHTHTHYYYLTSVSINLSDSQGEKMLKIISFSEFNMFFVFIKTEHNDFVPFYMN